MQGSKRRFTKKSAIKALLKLSAISAFSISLLACSGKTADEHIEQARVFAEQGDTQAAIVELKNAVQENPQLAAARFELGKVYLSTNKYDSAEKELSRALELGQPAADVIPLLSQAYQRTGANVALSELEIDESQLTSVERLEFGYRKLQSLVQLEKNADARNLIDDLLLIESTSVYRGLVSAVQQVLNQDFPAALEVAKTLKAQAPLNRDVLNFTARMYILNEQMGEATKVYEDYIKVAPDDIEIKFGLANILVEQGETERAEVHIDDLLAINSNNALLNQLKGVTRAAAEDHAAALEYSENSIKFGRADPTSRLIAGYSAFKLGEFEKAVGHLAFIAEFLPDNHPGLRILAASQLQANMGDQTDEVLARLDNITAEDASLFSRAGYELLKAGDEDAARTVIEQAEKISETADDLTRLGILKLSLNDVEGLLDLEQAVDKAPESVTAKTTLASAYLSTGQLDKALALAKEWQTAAAASVDGYLLQAEVEQRQDDFVASQSTLDKAKTLAPESEAVQVAQIRLYLRQSKNEEALTATEQLLSKAPSNIVGLASYFALKAQKGNSAAAYEKIKAQQAANPDNVPIRLLTARAAIATNNVNDAIDVLDDINADKSSPNQYWALYGSALLRANKVNEAETHYNKWAELYPNQESAVLGQLLILDGKREYEKALNIATNFLVREDNLQVQFIQAYLYAMNNRLTEAKNALKNIDEQYIQLPFLRGVKARIALLENKPEDAIDDAKVAYDANRNINNLLVLTRAYDLTGKSDLSFSVIKAHSNDAPRDVRVLMLLGERQIQKGSIVDAMSTYERVIEITPNNFVVLNNLAYLAMEEGQLDKAAELSKKAYDIRPDNVATADTYAQVLLKQDKVEDAVDVYNRAITDEVKNEEILLNFIESLLLSGNKLIAERRLNELSLRSPISKDRAERLKKDYDL